MNNLAGKGHSGRRCVDNRARLGDHDTRKRVSFGHGRRIRTARNRRKEPAVETVARSGGINHTIVGQKARCQHIRCQRKRAKRPLFKRPFRDVKRAKIRTVAYTHAHEDHVNGLLDLDGAVAFPHLDRIYVPEQEVSLFGAYPGLVQFQLLIMPLGVQSRHLVDRV